MTNESPIHIARAGTVIAAVYMDSALAISYGVTVGKDTDELAVFTLEELCLLHQAVEQAEYFIRYQEQMGRMLWCPGCGNG